MTSLPFRRASLPPPRTLAPLTLVLCISSGIVSGQVDMDINKAVWQQRYGVLDAQINEHAPYAGWLSGDADGDGVRNSDEFAAGTNPFKKLPSDPHFRPPDVSMNPETLSLGFPTVPGKHYQAESNQSLVDAWDGGALPGVTGDGSRKTLDVPKSAGRFFRVRVSDRSSASDEVGDWAKIALGFSASTKMNAQSSYDRSSLASALAAQNVVTLTAPTATAVQPGTATVPGEAGVIKITRSGAILPGAVTIPLINGGTAVEGVDYAALPSAITFPPGVGSVEIRIDPLHNPQRRSTATVWLEAAAPGSAGAAGNYRLGVPSSAGVTIMPSDRANGTGLTAEYYAGAHTTYESPVNFGGVAATYNYTRLTSSTGIVVVSHTIPSATLLSTGDPVRLQFTTGRLNTAPFNLLSTHTVTTPAIAGSFVIAVTGANLPVSGTGDLIAAEFSAPVKRIDPTIDFTYSYGTPNGINHIPADNYSVRWEGYLSPSSAGNYTFQLNADDKARVLLDRNDGSGLTRILENGWDSAATGAFKQSAAIPLTTTAGRYRIMVEFVETEGDAKCRLQWKQGTGSFANIPAANVFTIAAETTTGWNASYFANTTFTGPAARTQTDSAITHGNNGDWGAGTPDARIPHNGFTARWRGQVLPQYTGLHYFVAKNDEGVRLWVNDQMVLTRWGALGETTGSIHLQAGVWYDIQMDYNEISGPAESHLSWYSDDQAKQTIPMERLSPTISGVAPEAGNPPAAPPAITSPVRAGAIVGSGTPFTLPVAGSNSGVTTFSGLPPWLSFADGMLSGTPPAAGTYQFTATATNESGSGSAIITIEVQAAAGTLTRELWTSGVGGSLISDVPWDSIPSATGSVASAEDNGTYGANTGVRLRGSFIAPASGNYYFWIAASNTAELWISNDEEPVNKVRRARVTGPAGTGKRVWNAQAGQKSPWISLVEGRKYYIEALHNTGASGSSNHVSIGWAIDPTGNTADLLADGTGVMPSHVLSPWENRPTTAVSGTLFITTLQAAEGLSRSGARGGAFLRLAGSSAVLQLDHSGLSSGVISRTIVDDAGAVLFDIGKQERNHPALKTSDGGFTWQLTPSDLAALENGGVHLRIATVDHPAGEITGTFGKIAGSQKAPPIPSYPAWTDLHASSDAANSRFLSQATFGPGPADMQAVKANGYRAWIESQFFLEPSRTTPQLRAALTNDPQTPHPAAQYFNAWWKNAVTAPDQLRQRAAFALSEIFVISNTGVLENNGITLSLYYDGLIDSAFGNFREILKRVTLSPAMGYYLDMRGNAAGSIINGTHPNENYAREILQLFSTGLYRRWDDGSLVLNSKGEPVPTYDQATVTGFARAFTGWTSGQALSGGRLPTTFNAPANYLDPMVLVATKHDLGRKTLLDNVTLPPAVITSQADASTDPSSAITIESTHPQLGIGNVVSTAITNRYDLYGLRDLEQALDNITNNPSVAPFICRQLIQRLVTSHPRPEYVNRVVRAFNGERNVDGVATGVRGDMKEVFRAILLDYEARSAPAMADAAFGKQREPLMRVAGPARAFPSATLSGCSYRQSGFQHVLITSPVPHRLANDNVLLEDPVATGGGNGWLPSAQAYAGNATPSYSLAGATGIATINAPAYRAGDAVAIQFTSGVLGSTAPFNTVRTYTVLAATPASFTIQIGRTDLPNVNSGTTSTPHNFTISHTGLVAGNYTSTGSTVTINTASVEAGHRLYVKFHTGGLAGGSYDGAYTVTSATSGNFTITLPSSPANTAGSVLIPRMPAGYAVNSANGGSTVTMHVSGFHNLMAGDPVQINFRLFNAGIPAADGIYTVAAVTGPNTFTVTTPTPIGNGVQGGLGSHVYPLGVPALDGGGKVSVNPSTWNVGSSQNELAQSPLNSPTVFNFFYPDYQYPGEMALAGMTTPEFQLTNESTIMNLTNAITGSILSSTNPNGYISYKGGVGSITSDLGPYMTEALTRDAGIPGLVDKLADLLTGGNLSSGARAMIVRYATNTANFPFSDPPTNPQMRDRIRAIVHLIATSPDYAIQK